MTHFMPSRTRKRRGALRVRWAAGLLVGLALALDPALVNPSPGDGSTAVDPPDTTISGSVVLPAPGDHEIIPAVSQPIHAGEYFKFAVNWGIINGGNAYLEVPETTQYNGHPVFRLMARAESNAVVSRIYKVRNRIESMWDRNGLFSWRYAEDRREGKYRAKNEILFDQVRGEARYNTGAVYPVPPRVQDALSSFYYTRFQALPIGGSIVLDYHAGRKSQPLEVKVLGRERVETPAGTFDCVAVEPMLKAGGVFKNKGRLVIWLTADERRMPVLMKSKVTIGSITVELQEFRTGA